jgi:hypothetical protein
MLRITILASGRRIQILELLSSDGVRLLAAFSLLTSEWNFVIRVLSVCPSSPAMNTKGIK